MTDLTNSPAHIRHAMTIEELEAEAKLWMTGADIPDAKSAEDFAAFLTRVAAADKAAKADKEAEFRPHKDAADAVTESYAPTLKAAKRIMDEGKALISAFERKRAAEQARIAAEARAEAERKAEAARQAMRDSAGDLEARQQAEALVEAAKTHEIAATVIAKTDDRVKIGGRRVAMREVVEVEVTDATALLKWLWLNHKGELVTFATGIAEREAKAGRAPDGCAINRERKVA